MKRRRELSEILRQQGVCDLADIWTPQMRAWV